jgi:TonB family protein
MGEESPAVTRSLGYLGEMLMKQKRYQEAGEAFRRALAITEKQNDLDPTARIWILTSLARVAGHTGEKQTAEALYGRAVAIERDARGPTHPAVIARLEEAAEMMQRLGLDSARQKLLSELESIQKQRRQGDVVFQKEDAADPPRPRKMSEPIYSEEARRLRYEATVLLGADIMPDGKPENMRIYRCAGHGLDEKAIATVRRWRFDPARRNGKAVAVSVTVEVNFRLRDK